MVARKIKGLQFGYNLVLKLTFFGDKKSKFSNKIKLLKMDLYVFNMESIFFHNLC